jgi:hypothetical protein
MKRVGELGQDGCGMLLARSGEQGHVRLITNSGGDHGELLRRLSFAEDRLRIAATGGPVVIEVGERLQGWPWACGFSHDLKRRAAG